MQPSPIIFLRKIATFDPWRTQKSLRKHEHPITSNSFVETALIKGKRTKVNLHLLNSVLVNPLNLRNVWDENRRDEESHSLKQVSENNKGGKFLKKNWLLCCVGGRVSQGNLVLSYKLRCYTRISSPEKSRDNTREKLRYFFTCVWYRQSAADTSLAFRATRSGWWMNSKAFTILNTKTFVGIFSDYGR